MKHPDSYIQPCSWEALEEFKEYVGYRVQRMDTSGYRLPKTYACYHYLPRFPRVHLPLSGMEQLRANQKDFHP